jgi:repressor LexA
MLTAKQKKLLDFINSYFKENSIYPTYEEMKNALHIKSKSSIHKLISSIEERGFIERIPHKARAIQFKDNREKKNLTKIPFLGKIAAGNPIEAITSSFEQVSVPDYLVNNTYEHFTLEVVGDSMKDEGILNGDVVVIRKSNVATTGDIVVALIDENEVTLKKFRSFKNSIALEPANKNYKIRIFGPERVRIQGILVGLIRKF